MNKTIRALLILVLVSALALSVILFSSYQERSKRLRDTLLLLDSSRDSWQTTAAEKEALQEQRDTLRSELKEAELSLQEAKDRSASLSEEINELEKKLESLSDITSP